MKIAFLSDRFGSDVDLYLMNLDGTDLKQVTASDDDEGHPEWSPDGTVVAFGLFDPWGGPVDIRVFHLESGEDTYLTTASGFWWDIDWSPDSSRIAFVSDEGANQDIYVIAADGTGQTTLTTDPALDVAPSWSEGDRIFFLSDRDGAVLNVHSMAEDGGGQANLTNSAVGETYPVASPDGSRVVFTRNEGGANTDLYLMNADGTDVVRITPGIDSEHYFEARWSPDGRYITFTSHANSVYKIHRTDADGTGMIDLTDGQAHDERASWTPDSAQLVFVSRRDGDEGEIYIMDADGSNQTRLTNNPATDRDPVVQSRG